MNEYESKLIIKRTIRRGFSLFSIDPSSPQRPGRKGRPRLIPCSPLIPLSPQRPGRGLRVFTEALACPPPPGLRLGDRHGAAGRGLRESAEGLRLLSGAQSTPPRQNLFSAHDLYWGNVVFWAALPCHIITYSNIDNSFIF